MGLRFRKSISIMPGVKLNLGKTGMSISAGVPGFRKTFHTSGRVTTTVGIPGTGIYYVDTKNPSNKATTTSHRRKDSQRPQVQYSPSNGHAESDHSASYDVWDAYTAAETFSPSTTPCVKSVPLNNVQFDEPNFPQETMQIDVVALKSIHKTSDDTIDWTEVLVSPVAPDNTYDQEMWRYYHGFAGRVLSGDIDTYLQLIYEVNPLDDLLAYGGSYEFGTDNPQKIEVEFSVNEAALFTAKSQMSINAYNELLQDFVCSVCIRIARDMFALLPISHTIVHAVLNGETIISVDFDRTTLSRVKFGYVDSTETLQRFKNNMEFNVDSGFSSVTAINENK